MQNKTHRKERFCINDSKTREAQSVNKEPCPMISSQRFLRVIGIAALPLLLSLALAAAGPCNPSDMQGEPIRASRLVTVGDAATHDQSPPLASLATVQAEND